MNPIWFATVVISDGAIFGLLALIFRALRKMNRMADQHNMMWADYAAEHGIPFDPGRGNGAVLGRTKILGSS